MSKIGARIIGRAPARIAVAVSALLLLGGCASSGESGDTSAAPADADLSEYAAALPQRIIDQGNIIAFMQTPAPPFEWVDESTGELTGIDVDFLHAISELIEFPIEIEQVSDFATLVPAVQSGRANIVMSGILDKLERQEVGDFVDYLKGGTSFWTVADAGFSSHEDFCGQTVVTSTGTDYVQQLEGLSGRLCPAGPPINVLAITGAFAAQYDQVKQGRAVAIVQGPDFAGYESTNNYPGELEMVGEIINPNVYGIMVDTGLPELRDVVQSAMTELFENGTYTEILQKYGQEAGAVEAITVNSATS